MHYKNIPFSGVCIKIFNKFTLCFFYFVDILLYPNLPSFVKKKKKVEILALTTLRWFVYISIQ